MNTTINTIVNNYVDDLLGKITDHLQLEGASVEELRRLADDVLGATKKTKSGSGSGAPRKKKEMSAYLIFCSQMRAQVKQPDMNFGEVSRRLGEMWRNLTAEERASYANKIPSTDSIPETGDITITDSIPETDTTTINIEESLPETTTTTNIETNTENVPTTTTTKPVKSTKVKKSSKTSN